MANLKDIRTRIESTKNTQQITRAMKMVSAAKLRRAQQNIVNSRPYAKRILSVIADLALTHQVEHPLLTLTQETKRVLLVVLTSDRGLCGAFNTNIGKYADTFYKEKKGQYEVIDFLFIGTKGRDFVRRRNPGVEPVEVIENMSKDISYGMAAKIADQLIDHYTEGKYDEIRLVYNEFKSAISQNVVAERILPIDHSQSTFNEGEESGPGFSKDFIFEPSPEEMIDQLLKKHFAVQVYRCMSESVASEHGSRMSSMENATKNAGEMISKLTLTYNKARQASITTELIEITSGAEALNG